MTSTTRPTVGITAAVEEVGYGPWKDIPAALAPMSYARSALRAGGRPILLVPNPEDAEDPSELLGLLDALIISGGAGDLDPALYGQEETSPTTLQRIGGARVGRNSFRKFHVYLRG
jgi:putative glutamine amidotransferase